MARAWVHIGWPKTGTTALQYALRNGNFDFVVPQDGHKSDNFELFVNALGDPHGDAHGAAMSEYRRCVDTGRDLVISSEHLSGQIERAKALLAVLQRDFDSIHMVSVLRPLGELIPSILTQNASFPPRVKPQPTKPDGPIRTTLMVRALPRFRAWHDLLPADHITALRYGPETKADIVPELIKLFQGHSDAVPRGIHNPSDTAAFYALRSVALYCLQAPLSPAEERGLGALTTLVRHLKSDKLALTDALLDQVETEYREDLDWILDRYGIELRGARPQGIAVATAADVAQLALSYVPRVRMIIRGLRVGVPREIDDVVQQVRSWIDFLGAVPELPGVPVGFDARRYLALHPDLVTAEVDPATHYRQHGFFEARAF